MDGNSASLIAFALAVFLIVLIGVIIMISKDRPTEKPSQRSARDRHEANGGRVSNTRSKRHDFMARVKVGDKIWIEYDNWRPKINMAKCVNNNPHLKKMRVWWEWSEQAQAQGYPKSESMILSYDSKELENFELLNPKYCQQPEQPEKPKEETKEEKVARLNVELEDAIKEEKFEKAVEITKEIDKLTSTEI